LQNNDALKANASNIDIYTEEAKISYAEFFPKFRSQVQYSLLDRTPAFIIKKNAFSPGIPASDIELPAGEREIYAFTLSVEQPLFTGGYITSNYKRAKLQKKASELNLENVKNEIIRKIKSVYYDILKLNKKRETQKQILKLKEEHRHIAKELYKEGLSNKEDLLSLHADISRQRLELFKTENEINILKRTLKNLMGMHDETEISLAERLENKKLIITLPQSKDIALKNREDLLEAYYRVKITEREIEIARSNFYPRASVTGSYTRQKETPLANPDLWTLLLTLRWNIFEWGKTRADVNRARARYEKLRSQYASIKKEIMLDVEEKWFKVKEAEHMVRVAKEDLIHAEEHYKNAVLKYKEKLLRSVELLEAETFLIRSKNEYIQSLYDLNKALAEFEFAISSDITPFVTEEEIYKPRVKVIEINTIQRNPPGAGDIIEETAAYYIQVGAFKNPENAQRLLKRLRVYYPEAYITVTGKFNKVRIDVKTEEEGKIILKKIKERLNLKALLRRHG